MAVLSAPSSPHEERVLSTVILVVSVLSACGAAFIALSFICFKSLRGYRHQLILGLAISDFWMAINFLSSASMNLSGRSIGAPEQQKFCSFNGFMVQVFVVQTDYWVLIIAACTYLILADHKRWAKWIQDRSYIIWILPWFLSILWAILGLTIVGYGDIGAWCWFTSDRIRLLVNFLPRWFIIITILALYIRLYFIIHNAHHRFRSFDDVELTSESNNLPDTTSQNTSRMSKMVMKFSQGSVSANGSACENVSDEVTVVNLEAARSGRVMHGRSPTMLKRVAYQMMAYPIVYLLIWTIPTTIRIYQSTTGKAAPFAIGTVDKACIVIQGLADAIVYGWNEHTWGVWRTVFRKRVDL